MTQATPGVDEAALYRIARRALRRVPHAPRDREDLIQEAVIGVLRASQRWSPEKASLAVYAGYRAQGAARDALREGRVGRRPGLESLDVVASADGDGDTRAAFVAAREDGSLDARLHVEEMLAWLPRRDAEVLRRHYGVGCMPQRFADIARAVDVCESRASQIHAATLRRLREEAGLRARTG